MKSRHAVSALMACLLGTVIHAASAAPVDDTLQRLTGRYLGWKDLCAQLQLKNVSKTGATQEGSARLCVLFAADGSRYGRVTVMSPAVARGMDLITRAEIVAQVNTLGKSRQWLYMPASRRATAINANNTETPFLGSEFSYADLDLGYLDPTRLSRIDEVACGAERCQRYTVSGTGTGSVHRIVWVATGTGAIRQVELQKQSKPYKILEIRHEVRDAAGWWIADRLVMRNLQTGGRTESTWTDTHYNAGLTQDKFDPKKLYGPAAAGHP